VGVAHLIRVTVGGGPKPSATWAHWQVALAYAKYLSNEFHRFVNEAFREWAEEQADPDLKARRAIEGYRRRGKDDGWILARLDGIVQRRRFTETLKDHGVQGAGFAICTDGINKEVLGHSARQLKRARGVPAGARTRDQLGALELAALRFAEAMAEERMGDDHVRGNAACGRLCREAGTATRRAMDSMGLALRTA
jgi:hypothetical protein